MKKSIFILTLLLLSFCSCNKEKGADKDPNSYSQLILGTWRYAEKFNNGYSQNISNFWTLTFDGTKVRLPDDDSNYVYCFYTIYGDLMYWGEDAQMSTGFWKYIIKEITPYELVIFHTGDSVNYRLIR